MLIAAFLFHLFLSYQYNNEILRLPNLADYLLSIIDQCLIDEKLSVYITTFYKMITINFWKFYMEKLNLILTLSDTENLRRVRTLIHVHVRQGAVDHILLRAVATIDDILIARFILRGVRSIIFHILLLLVQPSLYVLTYTTHVSCISFE